jgi:hypothetical protein
MTRLLLLPTALLAATVALAAAPWRADPAPRPAQDHEESALEESMERMKGAVRRMERALEGDDLAQVLPLIAEFQAAAVVAKGETPTRAATLEGEARDAFVKDYRGTMVKLLRVTCDLEQAVLEGRSADAARIFGSELKALQKPSHERFQVEDEH